MAAAATRTLCHTLQRPKPKQAILGGSWKGPFCIARQMHQYSFNLNRPLATQVAV
jgi:hypothetical protein